MTAGAWVVVAAVVVAIGFGLWRRRTDGRFRAAEGLDSLVAGAPPGSTTDPGSADGRAAEPLGEASRDLRPEAPDPTPTPWADRLGERATLLQFSSAFCAPCRATRAVLGQVAESHDGVTHVEIDAEQHLDVVRRLGIMRTPTTLVLDPAGRELGRAVGAPTRSQVEASLPA